MSKNNIITVAVVVALSLALTLGLAFWLGPEAGQNLTDTTTNEISEDGSKVAEDKGKLTSPLNAENLKAYQASMTNPNNPVAEFNTNQGKIEMELFADTMPITAGNFIKLAKEGFYDGVKFHRVIENFMIQSGDPISKTDEYLRYGTGNAGYTIPDEHVAGEYLTNVRGTISMANSGPESGSSQFFINTGDNTFLDFDKEPLSSKHPVFGRVVAGMDVVDKIGVAKTNKPISDMPVDPIIIESIVIKE